MGLALGQNSSSAAAGSQVASVMCPASAAGGGLVWLLYGNVDVLMVNQLLRLCAAGVGGATVVATGDPASVALVRRAGLRAIDVMGLLWAVHGVRTARGELPVTRGHNADFRSPLWRLLAYGKGLLMRAALQPACVREVVYFDNDVGLNAATAYDWARPGSALLVTPAYLSGSGVDVVCKCEFEITDWCNTGAMRMRRAPAALALMERWERRSVDAVYNFARSCQDPYGWADQTAFTTALQDGGWQRGLPGPAKCSQERDVAYPCVFNTIRTRRGTKKQRRELCPDPKAHMVIHAICLQPARRKREFLAACGYLDRPQIDNLTEALSGLGGCLSSMRD